MSDPIFLSFYRGIGVEIVPSKKGKYYRSRINKKICVCNSDIESLAIAIDSFLDDPTWSREI